jgi:hypothetical protein
LALDFGKAELQNFFKISCNQTFKSSIGFDTVAMKFPN